MNTKTTHVHVFTRKGWEGGKRRGKQTNMKRSEVNQFCCQPYWVAFQIKHTPKLTQVSWVFRSQTHKVSSYCWIWLFMRKVFLNIFWYRFKIQRRLGDIEEQHKGLLFVWNINVWSLHWLGEEMNPGFLCHTLVILRLITQPWLLNLQVLIS